MSGICNNILKSSYVFRSIFHKNKFCILYFLTVNVMMDINYERIRVLVKDSFWADPVSQYIINLNLWYIFSLLLS